MHYVPHNVSHHKCFVFQTHGILGLQTTGAVVRNRGRCGVVEGLLPASWCLSREAGDSGEWRWGAYTDTHYPHKYVF